MTAYKFGKVLVVIYIGITITMFSVLEEMAILLAYNFLVVGAIILILYFILTVIYNTLDKRVFLFCLLIVVLIPTYFFIGQKYEENKIRESWNHFAEFEVVSIGDEITLNYGPKEKDLIKFKINSIEEKGNLSIKIISFTPGEKPEIQVFQPRNNDYIIVGQSVDNNWIVENVRIGDTYFFELNQGMLNYKTLGGTYTIKIELK
jgi:hypothetical protein